MVASLGGMSPRAAEVVAEAAWFALAGPEVGAGFLPSVIVPRDCPGSVDT